MKPKRPKSVTWLAVAVLMLTGIQLIRFAIAIRNWDYLLSQRLPVSPLFFAISGMIWGLVGLGICWGLWRGTGWAVRYTQLAVIGFAIYYWADKLFLMIDPLRNTSFPFAIGMTLILLATTLWIISRPKAQLFFGETYE